MLSSILSEYCCPSATTTTTATSPFKSNKVGLFVSPHLREVRERIQINGRPLSHDQFAKYVFQVWDRFAEAEARAGPPASPQPRLPAYFRFLTFVALHAFRQEKVDAAVLETGIGGEYDCTNLVPQPAVTGVTSLGLDHVQLLGNTLPKIAWHKAGIFKPGVPAFSVPQPDGAAAVLRDRAAERQTADDGIVHFVDVHPQIASEEAKIGLAGDFQKLNASLAVAMASRFLRDRGIDLPTDGSLPDQFRRGLQSVRWPGRCDRRPDNEQRNVTWYIDGAHTTESIALARQWFVNTTEPKGGEKSAHPKRALIFYQQTRDSIPLLAELAKLETDPGRPFFSHVFFTTNVAFGPSDRSTKARAAADTFSALHTEMTGWNNDPLALQRRHLSEWQDLVRSRDVDENGHQGRQQLKVTASIAEAVEECRRLGVAGSDEHLHVLVTGSLYLAGGMLEVIDGSLSSSTAV